MNRRNVETLALQIEAYLERFGLDRGPHHMAEKLAALGVLVVDALTDEQCLTVLRESRDWERGWESLTRAALARIAKGETP
jgi:hypothetical protein